MSTTTELHTSDYGSNISISRRVTSEDGSFETTLIFETNADEFLPDKSEFNSDWDINAYIDEYLSFFEFDSEEDKEYVREALHRSKLRYLAVDSYNQWESGQK